MAFFEVLGELNSTRYKTNSLKKLKTKTVHNQDLILDINSSLLSLKMDSRSSYDASCFMRASLLGPGAALNSRYHLELSTPLEKHNISVMKEILLKL